jgi:hypothetical protein
MKRLAVWMVAVSIVALTAGCSFRGNYHDPALPDPKHYNAHFGDMDSKKDGLISWEEFKAFFPQAEPKVFSAIDINKDGYIDLDEWHKFEEAHRLKHPD